MRKIAGIGLLIFLASCASNPYRGSEKIYTKQIRSFTKELRKKEANAFLDSAGNTLTSQWVSTVNFNLRKPNYVIIHHTAQKNVDATLKTFTLAKTQVSAHYLIGSDGTVTQLVNDYLRAWHGGVAKWGSISDINSVAIGIELDNDGFSPFSDVQINSLIAVLQKLKTSYTIPRSNFIGHSDIAPSRKVDPSIYFPWAKLADKGFGYMPAPLLTEPVPSNFDPLLALRVIGYDTKDGAAAIAAFKRHFLGKIDDSDLSEGDLRALYNVYCKY
ncbi:MAG: N-acetylmuramoyl-L-alanine amidase [Sphingobacteriaceae bacterium]